MSFDLFGHGPRLLPFNDSSRFSDGPDRKHGPSRCRGVQGGCYDGNTPNPHDHSCCCDPCRHTFVDVCGQHCCRCIPKQICAVFTPNTITTRCKQRAWRMTAVTSDNDRTRSFYSFNTGGGTISLSVGFEPQADYEYGDCSWRLDSDEYDIHEIGYIDHSGEIHCQAPPEFIIENIDLPYSVLGVSNSCLGTITFQEAAESKIPFQYRWYDFSPKFYSSPNICCEEVCAVLCVKFGNQNESTYTKKEFFFDSSLNRWGAQDGEGLYFELVELYDECFIKLTEVGIKTLNGDLIAIEQGKCSVGLDLTAVDYDGNYIRISCNPCSCWERICGNCRCVCPNLCMTGIEDGQPIEPTILAWDRDELRWGDDYFSVSIGNDGYGNCIAVITGFDDPVSIPNTCGSDLSFFVSESLEDQLANGATNFLAFRCADCIGTCSAGTCLDECEDVPSVLFAELSAAPWEEMLGCNPAELCFETIIIPLVQIFASTLSNPAGEWRWIGSGIISCKNCLNATRTNHTAQIDLGCDGAGTLSVTDGTVTCSFDFSFILPCNGEGWDLQFDPFTDCDALPGCCDVGGYVLGITE